MDFDLSDEQRLMIETAARVGADFGPEYWRAKDAAKDFPSECWAAICEAMRPAPATPTRRISRVPSTGVRPGLPRRSSSAA